MNDEDGLHILSLEAENFKRLKAIRIVPTPGGMVKLVGRNGQGKTSVIDAIAAALGGKEHLPAVPVRVGQDEGEIKIDLGSLKVRLGFDKTRGSWLSVISDDKRLKTPQQVLDRMASELTLDPMEFMQLKADERIAVIKKLIPGFDFAANARSRKDAYDRRTDIGRDYKREKAVLDSMPVQPMERPLEINVSAVAAELRVAEEHNIKAAGIERQKTTIDAKIEGLQAEISEWKARIIAAFREIVALQEQYDSLAAIDDIDTSGLHATLAAAHDTNRAAEQYDRAISMLKAVEDHRNELRRLDVAINNLDDLKVKAVQDAKLPVENLGFGDEDVTIDGLPYEQASSSQQLMVATAITMSLRPTLRVILVRQGPLLDPEHLTLLAKIAAERGYQLWLERIDDGKESGIIIEDGEVLEVRP